MGFYYADYWGLTERPAKSGSSPGQVEEELGFLSALCNASGADGEASKLERDHIKGMASIKGMLPEVIAKIDEMCDAAEKKTIEQIATDAAEAMSIGTLRFAASCIIFESNKAAAKDGLDEKESEAINIIAAKMGISKEKVQEMMESLAEEETLKKKRIAICLPDHPCLADKYKN